MTLARQGAALDVSTLALYSCFLAFSTAVDCS
jgi:hypothetical protein